MSIHRCLELYGWMWRKRNSSLLARRQSDKTETIFYFLGYNYINIKSKMPIKALNCLQILLKMSICLDIQNLTIKFQSFSQQKDGK